MRRITRYADRRRYPTETRSLMHFIGDLSLCFLFLFFFFFFLRSSSAREDRCDDEAVTREGGSCSPEVNRSLFNLFLSASGRVGSAVVSIPIRSSWQDVSSGVYSRIN